MDDRCAWTPITVAAQTASTADLTFNRVKGQPNISILPFNGNPSSMSADGSAVVGTDANLVGYWMWTASGGYREIGGFAPAGGYPGISDDGSKVSGTVRDTDGILKWGLYDVAAQTWTVLPPSPGTPTSPTCFVAVNGFGNFPSYGLPWGISGDGSTVVGSSYQDRASSGTCRMSRAAKWTAATGTVILPKAAPSTTTNSSRANWASYDGSVIAGFDDAPSRGGAYWVNGVEHLLGGQTAANYVGESVFVTRDGSTVTGGTGNGNALAGAYKHYTTNDQTEIVHVGTEPFLTSSSVWRTNDSGNVVAGFDKYSNLFDSKLWTPEVGWVGVQAFLNAQGTYFEGGTIANIQALSGDGRTWAVLGATSYGTTPLLVEIPKAIVCHKSPGGQNTTTHNLDVTFPDGLEDHLAHGDTLGLCEHGGE
jgi:hypothetical protein